MAKRIVVYVAPSTLDKSGHKKEKRGLRLVEVGDQGADYVKVIARSNDDLGGSMEYGGFVAVEPVENVLQVAKGQPLVVNRRCSRVIFIGFPLGYTKLLLCGFGMVLHLAANIVKAFKRTDRGSTNGNAVPLVVQEPLDGVSSNDNVFAVHLVVTDFLGLDWLEGTCTNVKGKFITFDTSGIKCLENGGGEVEPGSRCGHTTLYLGIDSLIGLQVTLLSSTVEIRWYGQLAYGLKNFGKGEGGIVPCEPHAMLSAIGSIDIEGKTFGSQPDRMTTHFD